MLVATKYTTYQGTSSVTVSNQQTTIATFFGQIGEDGNININKTINNAEMYETHKEEVDADFKEFMSEVYSD